MAEFSKQWCELNDPEMPHDFCIDEIAENLENNHYTSIICEGFGFLAIGKDLHGEIILAVPINDDEIEWKKYPDLVANYKNSRP